MLQGMSSRVLRFRKWSKTTGRTTEIIKDDKKIFIIHKNNHLRDITIVCYTFEPIGWNTYKELLEMMKSYPTRGYNLTHCFGNLQFKDDFYGN